MNMFSKIDDDDESDDFETMGMGVGSAMKEDLKKEKESEQLTMFSHWDEETNTKEKN